MEEKSLGDYKYGEIRQQILNARETKSAVLFKKLFTDVPNWEAFINHLNIQLSRKEAASIPNAPLKEHVLNGVVKRNDSFFYFYTHKGWYLEDFPEVQNIMDAINEILSEDYGRQVCNPAGAFMNFAAEGFKVPSHGDDRETLFWQCIGTTTWNFREPDSFGAGEPFLSIKMEPGDCVYVGHWVEHEVIFDGPRAGIAFNI